MILTCAVASCGKVFDHYSSDVTRVQTDAARLGWWWRGSPAGRQWYCDSHPRVVAPQPAYRPTWPAPPAEPAKIRITPPMRRLLAALMDADDALWAGDLARRSKVTFGSTYAMLRMLTDRGWVTVQPGPALRGGGPARHLYQLTPAACERAAETLKED